ncbi:MAG: efflux transporter outer membrane subunit [Magnetococcales bacterium]|nr:efflux transporter outer membrane subunit [Magnetococcales bacterium]
MTRIALGSLLAILGLTACSLMNLPDPALELSIPAQWPTAALEENPEDEDKLPEWREFYGHAGLADLIAIALENNRDLRLAASRVRKAAALAGVAESNRWPGIQGNLSLSASRTPGDLNSNKQVSLTHRLDTGLTLSSFEIDLWGRLASLDAAEEARFLASEEALRAVRVVLIASVAEAFVSWREAVERVELSTALVANRESSLNLTRRRGGEGLASRRQVTEAEVALESARADLAEAVRIRESARNALELLLTRPDGLAETWPPLRDIDLDRPLSADLPSGLLLKRPDIVAAEKKLQGANGDVAAARANYLPRIALTASGGTASHALDGLFAAGSGAWSFLPSVTLPIFDIKRKQQEEMAAAAERDGLLASYEKAVQQGFREVAESLAVQKSIRQRKHSLHEALLSREEQLSLTGKRLKAGLDGKAELLESERAVLLARSQALAAEKQAISARIQLYKVLGGGGNP